MTGRRLVGSASRSAGLGCSRSPRLVLGAQIEESAGDVAPIADRRGFRHGSGPGGPGPCSFLARGHHSTAGSAGTPLLSNQGRLRRLVGSGCQGSGGAGSCSIR